MLKKKLQKAPSSKPKANQTTPKKPVRQPLLYGTY